MRTGNGLSVARIAEYIIQYENLSLDDFNDLSQEKREAIRMLLEQDVKCEQIANLEQNTNMERDVKNAANRKYWEECFYEFLATAYGNPKLIKDKSIFDYLSGLFGGNMFCLFAIACNLYAYALKMDIHGLRMNVEAYLADMNLNGVFGRYARAKDELDKLLLQYTTDYIPELNEWVDLLIYTNDIYPCIPDDMEWWRREGELQTSKSVYIAVNDYLNKYPDTIFKAYAERIQSNVLPVLYKKN